MFSKSIKRCRTGVLLLAIVLAGLNLVVPISALAASTTAAKSDTTAKNPEKDISQQVVQSFNADKSIQQGMIVRVTDKDKATIQAADQKSINYLLGVTIAPNDAPVTITPQTVDSQQVFVATSGRYSVLVTNQNGPIKSGDYITVSSIAGIGMTADQELPVILGTATSDFNGTSNVVGTVSLKDSSGKTRQVSIGRVTVNLDIARNPLKVAVASDFVPTFLSKAAITVANKPVSTARIYMGAITLLISALVSGVVLYSGVRSGMVAVGRNPLSKKSIIRSLIQTVLAGLIIFIVGVVLVYLLLKL
ncbi:MAG: rane protein of unknown function [Candidatus Saccharibacteria bacterium]|nr:rane protein of unknown function [Candidatus Saccharibacteria bacterium]